MAALWLYVYVWYEALYIRSLFQNCKAHSASLDMRYRRIKHYIFNTLKAFWSPLQSCWKWRWNSAETLSSSAYLSNLASSWARYFRKRSTWHFLVATAMAHYFISEQYKLFANITPSYLAKKGATPDGSSTISHNPSCIMLLQSSRFLSHSKCCFHLIHVAFEWKWK